MDVMRRAHNKYKLDLIRRCVKKGDRVLDCGCGRGGDFGKWRQVGVALTAVDPDGPSIDEAVRRAETYQLRNFCIHTGDIRNVHGVFDSVCFNFSIHYIRDTLKASAEALARKIRPGGLLFGIVPDADRIRTFVSPDRLGNTVSSDDTTATVRLMDGPFYAGEARTEPLMDRVTLNQAIEKWFEIVEWESMCEPTGLVSDIYSRFIFRRK